MLKHGTIALAATLLLAGCGEDGPQAPATQLTATEAQDVAAAVSDDAYAAIDAEFGAGAWATSGPTAGPAGAPPIEVSHSFEYTRPCRRGTVAVAGVSTGIIDRDNLHVVIETTATTTHEDCLVRPRRHPVVLDGAPNLVMNSRFERQNAMPIGPQTVSLAGAVDWSIPDTDRAGMCEVQLDVVWERTSEGGVQDGGRHGVRP